MTSDLPVFTLEQLEESAPLDLGHVTNDDAVDLGLTALEVASERGLSLAIEIVLEGDVVFRVKLAQTGPENDPWLTGKAAVARHFGVPSLLVRRRLEAAGETVSDHGLDPEHYRAHGGAIPLRAGGIVVGTLTASGAPDVVDHDVATEALRRYVGGMSHD
jgi:uncharacterized protein (UPF0303 family)